MEKVNGKVTFEQEAKIYEKAALAEIKKMIGDGSEDPTDIACILQSGRRAIYRAREELASCVEVVRCKDCKHLKYGYQCYYPLGMMLNNDGDAYVLVDPDKDFCSRGERRTEE